VEVYHVVQASREEPHLAELPKLPVEVGRFQTATENLWEPGFPLPSGLSQWIR